MSTPASHTPELTPRQKALEALHERFPVLMYRDHSDYGCILEEYHKAAVELGREDSAHAKRQRNQGWRDILKRLRSYSGYQNPPTSTGRAVVRTLYGSHVWQEDDSVSHLMPPAARNMVAATTAECVFEELVGRSGFREVVGATRPEVMRDFLEDLHHWVYSGITSELRALATSRLRVQGAPGTPSCDLESIGQRPIPSRDPSGILEEEEGDQRAEPGAPIEYPLREAGDTRGSLGERASGASLGNTQTASSA